MQNKHNFLKFTLFIGDIILIYLALYLALVVRYGGFPFWPEDKVIAFFFQFSFISVIWILLLYILDFYEIPLFKRVFDFFRNLLIFIFLASILGTTYFYLKPEIGIAPKTILFLDVLIFSLLLCSWRYIFYRILKIRNFREKIVIIGFRPGLEELTDKRFLSRAGYEILAFFAPDASFSEKLLAFTDMAKYGVVSDINKLKEIVEKERVSLIVFPRFLAGNETIVHQVFGNLPLKMNYISFADFYENLTKKVAIEAVNEAWFLENISKAERKADDVLKRGFDIIFSFFGLIIVSPLLGLIAIIIKMDSKGPVFYRGERVGRFGKTFKIWKFRTMVENAEKIGSIHASSNDPRITKIGKFLRKYKLDELPQLINILKGEMSFVGPRPQVKYYVDLYNEEEKISLIVRPGMTDYASIRYINQEDLVDEENVDKSYQEKIEPEKNQLRVKYAKNNSLLIDAKIIFQTILAIVKKIILKK